MFHTLLIICDRCLKLPNVDLLPTQMINLDLAGSDWWNQNRNIQRPSNNSQMYTYIVAFCLRWYPTKWLSISNLNFIHPSIFQLLHNNGSDKLNPNANEQNKISQNTHILFYWITSLIHEIRFFLFTINKEVWHQSSWKTYLCLRGDF